MNLCDKQCDCNTRGVQVLNSSRIEELIQEVENWEVIDSHHLKKEYRFPSYLDGVQFAVRLAAIAEEQNHHPSIILNYRRVVVEIYTHVVNGLTDNDFILAAKYDQLGK